MLNKEVWITAGITAALVVGFTVVYDQVIKPKFEKAA